jgi:hypothetical protein
LVRSEEVTLIESPSELRAITRCIYQRHNKEIAKILAQLLRLISKGYYYQEHYIDGLDNKGKIKTLELIAKQNGFRVEVKKQRDGFKIRFYGNTQEEVDDFVNLTVRNDFTLL